MTPLKLMKARLVAPIRKEVQPIAIGLALAGVPTLLRLAADPVITGTVFVTYYPFVLIAAVCLGWRGALGVAVASAVLGNFLFMAPRYTLFAEVGDTLGAASFLISCSAMLAIVEAIKGSVRELEASKARLAVERAKRAEARLAEELGQRLAAIGLALHVMKRDVADHVAITTIELALDEAKNELLLTRRGGGGESGS